MKCMQQKKNKINSAYLTHSVSLPEHSTLLLFCTVVRSTVSPKPYIMLTDPDEEQLKAARN